MAKRKNSLGKLFGYATADPFYFLKLFLLFVAYFITAKIGLSIDPVGGFATLVWPPSGIALAALLLFGKKLWPAIAAAAFLANFTQGAPWHVACGIAIGNTLEAVVATYLLRTLTHFRNSFEGIKDVWSYIVITVFACTTISATIGTASLLAGEVITQTTVAKTWSAWWIGDILACLIISPFIILWWKSFSRDINLRKTFETTILLFALCIVSLFVFMPTPMINNPTLPITYIIYLPLIVIALRLGPREHSLAMILLSAIAIWGTLNGHGIYARDHLSDSLILLQLYLGTTAVTFLTLSVLMQEKRMLESRKDEFLAIASHELKTPLTSTKVYVELIKNGLQKDNSKLYTYAQRADEGLSRLTKLVSDMLDINRINTGKLELSQEPIQIDELVEKAVRDMRKVIKNNKITLKSSSHDTIFADRYKITQVLTNLISNAAKFSDKNDKIEVSLSSNQHYVTVAVKDHGKGIDGKHLKSIFKRFYQASHIQGNSAGLGLGLYISNGIIKKHHGKMWVTSNIGKGSTFYFSLPKHKS